MIRIQDPSDGGFFVKSTACAFSTPTKLPGRRSESFKLQNEALAACPIIFVDQSSSPFPIIVVLNDARRLSLILAADIPNPRHHVAVVSTDNWSVSNLRRKSPMASGSGFCPSANLNLGASSYLQLCAPLSDIGFAAVVPESGRSIYREWRQISEL
ncbi:hypothetical protein [Ciceribacter sp. RN22]|uniref:hypothetical protein n=1 Tax=Ciceribacter sp. RN22 TaxID=2954932 RepID=UPI002093F19B|nr:hypothetical protein [Ciceribacter sp. RN22]MCO6180848.1 hypothetical protein [Ciceribacter sp. RN22]